MQLFAQSNTKYDLLPRVMALKAARYRKYFKNPKSIDYKTLRVNDPAKDNNRFVNT